MNNQLYVSFKIVACVVILLFIAGCASTPIPSPTLTPTPILLGTWGGTVTEENAIVIGGAKTLGQVELTFSDDGRFTLLMLGGGAMTLGGYTLAQDTIVIKDETSSCLKYGFPTATYKWSVENDILTLTAIDEVCYIRRKCLEGERFWIRKKTDGTPGTPVPTFVPLLR